MLTAAAVVMAPVHTYIMDMEKIDIKNLSLKELGVALRELGMPAYNARQIFEWLYKKRATGFDQMTNISKQLRTVLAERFRIPVLTMNRKQAGSDRTEKYQFVLGDGAAIESVLIPMGKWYTLCVSTQVGCAMGCTFCLTGIKGFKRNLTVSEITGQLAAVQAENPGIPVSHLVFMGMGEPFANEDATLKAIEILTSKEGYHYSSHRITVSTAGLVPQIRRFITESKVNLAVSLNALYDDTRTALMPINATYPIGELMAALKDYHNHRRGITTFEYVMIKGVNDGIAHAIQLAKMLKHFPFKVNLIPFNEHRGTDYERPDEENVIAFQTYLQNHTIACTVRTTHGEEIEAACGQLGGQTIAKEDSQ